MLANIDKTEVRPPAAHAPIARAEASPLPTGARRTAPRPRMLRAHARAWRACGADQRAGTGAAQLEQEPDGVGGHVCILVVKDGLHELSQRRPEVVRLVEMDDALGPQLRHQLASLQRASRIHRPCRADASMRNLLLLVG